MGFPGGSVVKNPPANAGDMGLIPGSGRSPEGGNGNPLPIFLPGEYLGQRSLVGFSPWGHEELTQLSTHAFFLDHYNYNTSIMTSNYKTLVKQKIFSAYKIIIFLFQISMQ